MSWKTKPTDRFVLRVIKRYLSAPISLAIVRIAPAIQPSTITLLAAALGVIGGVVFALGFAWPGALLAALAQVLDGVDGQVARLTDRTSVRGAFLDSVVDRYMDFSLMFGMLLYALRVSAGHHLLGIPLTTEVLVGVAALAVVGSSQVSYTTARAASLGLAFERPESAGKGSRTTAIVLSGLATLGWVHAPLIGLLYLAIHPNLAVAVAVVRANSGSGAE